MLSSVIGQPIGVLQRWIANQDRQSACFLIAGNPGCGKSHTAKALAAELGCVDYWTGLETIPSSELSMDRLRKVFDVDMHATPIASPHRWRVVILEEFDGLSGGKQAERYLKVELERLPQRRLVIATANSTSGIEDALLQRFRLLTFRCGKLFADSYMPHLRQIWAAEAPEGVPFPAGCDGYYTLSPDNLFGMDNAYSMRLALRKLREAIDIAWAEREAVPA